MFSIDAQEKNTSLRSREGNIDRINADVISEIEKELQDSPYDIISLVFLLYDVPDTALQRLIVYQRVCGDVRSTNMNLLHEWVQGAKSRTSWKHEFLEALLICQLFGIVKKLGFHVRSLEKQYQPDNLQVNMYIDPIKKALYKLSENMDSKNLDRLKRTLSTYKIDVMLLDTCELIFLKLMSDRFITTTLVHNNKKMLGSEVNVEKLVKILEKLPGLECMAKDLRNLQKTDQDEPSSDLPVAASTPYSQSPPTDKPMTAHDFTDVMGMFNDLIIDDEHIKSDTKKLGKDNYAIKNSKRMGVCLIINQEDFCLSEMSIADETLTTVLGRRNGSSADMKILQTTMSSLNFEVVIGQNLNYKDMIDFIKETIKCQVQDNDSIFMLCILSHGVRGHVYSADCVKVNVEDIQGILDSDEASKLRGIPKILIIQACQVDDTTKVTLVADSPNHNRRNYLKKSDFLIYWATAPQYEAFRHEKCGSIFIQILCAAIQKRGRREHLFDIFTLVNNGVVHLCMEHKYVQVPIFESTLRKKLYLQMPE